MTGETVAVLRVDSLARAFGGVRAVDGVSFEVAKGERVALIGPNGAGKTTCFNLVNGQLRPDAGTITLAGRRIDGLAAAAIARSGVGRTFQRAEIFASMSVRENVATVLAIRDAEARRFVGALTAHRREATSALLERVGASEIADRGCSTLAYGDVKRVELALALATSPLLLLMDEPAAGMPPADRERLMRLATDLARDDGVAVLFTEHDMDIVFGFADRIIVLDRGRIVADGSPDAIRADMRVQEVYLGTG